MIVAAPAKNLNILVAKTEGLGFQPLPLRPKPRDPGFPRWYSQLMAADSSPRFPLAQKIGTAFRLLSYGPEVFWLGLRYTIGMPRKLPRDGLVRVGKQLFRPADAHTAGALLSGLY